VKSGIPPIANADVWSNPDEYRESVREFIGAMATELAELAYSTELDALAVACDVVREIATGKVKSQNRRVDCR
jgi:hypothetical protein